MSQKIKGLVRYNGTNFAGWQVQPGQRTVQGVLEDALTILTRQPIRIHGAGRTDSGVHALGQAFHCTVETEKPLDELRHSLSAMVGPDVQVLALDIADERFNARYDARAKRYGYCFYSGQESDPFSWDYAWRIPESIDRDRVHTLAQKLVGHHDFAGFASSGSSVQTTDRTIHSITLHAGPIVGPAGDDRHWHLVFHGDGFLYKMVRNITGTLIDVARRNVPEPRIEELLAASGPYQGHTAPAKGLFLMEVIY